TLDNPDSTGLPMSTPRQILRLLTLPCSEVSALVSEGCDRRLPRAERIAVGLHLAFCASCRRFRRQIQFLRCLVSRLRPDHESEIVPLPASSRFRPGSASGSSAPFEARNPERRVVLRQTLSGTSRGDDQLVSVIPARHRQPKLRPWSDPRRR